MFTQCVHLVNYARGAGSASFSAVRLPLQITVAQRVVQAHSHSTSDGRASVNATILCGARFVPQWWFIFQCFWWRRHFSVSTAAVHRSSVFRAPWSTLARVSVVGGWNFHDFSWRPVRRIRKVVEYITSQWHNKYTQFVSNIWLLCKRVIVNVIQLKYFIAFSIMSTFVLGFYFCNIFFL